MTFRSSVAAASLAAGLFVAAMAAPAAAEPPGQQPPPSILMKSPTGPGGRNITAFDRHPQSGVGGYYDIEFIQPFSGRGSYFDNHHLILELSSYLHDDLMFNAEIELEHGATINGGTDDGKLSVEQAWADWRVADALGLRAGVLLVPFGIVNVLHDSDIRETTTRPLMASTIVPTTWMEPGIGAHGVLYPTERLMVNYDVILTNGLTDDITAADGLRRARPSLKTDNNGNKAVATRVGLSPWLGMEVGLNGYYGAIDPSGTQGLAMGGADLAWTLGPAELVGEYARVRTPGGSRTAADGKVTPIPQDLEGYYLEGRYRFFPAVLDDTFLGRGGGFQNATFTLLARGGVADTDLAKADASDKVEWAVGVNYRPVQTFVPKLEFRRLLEPTTGLTTDAVWASVAAGF